MNITKRNTRFREIFSYGEILRLSKQALLHHLYQQNQAFSVYFLNDTLSDHQDPWNQEDICMDRGCNQCVFG